MNATLVEDLIDLDAWAADGAPASPGAPARPAEPAAVGVDPGTLPLPARLPWPAARPRILIVDDDEVVRQDLRELLEEGGIEVVGEAGDGASGVELACRLRPDVVVMDNRMPVLAGIESTRRIRERLPFAQVVILTAYDEVTLSGEAMDAGAYCYVVKGGPPALLLDVIRRAARFALELEARASERAAGLDGSGGAGR
ncbi:MAG TPA: response regulator transcription factor [Actinomycetota bacterium]|nr:response regulator transcription factor [Actinomycetota bacterium]